MMTRQVSRAQNDGKQGEGPWVIREQAAGAEDRCFDKRVRCKPRRRCTCRRSARSEAPASGESAWSGPTCPGQAVRG
jgi:hypothetical protein